MRGQEKRFAPILWTREEIMRALLNFSWGRYLHLLLLLLALVFTVSSCRNDQIEIPPLTGPSGHRLFITMQANPDHLIIRPRNRPREFSTITLQLKNQLGQGVPGENIKLRIVNATGGEINIGRLDKFNVVTDSAGFGTAIYTAPNTSEQPIAIGIRILAVLTNPAYPFEVFALHALDLERSGESPQPNQCIFGEPSGPQAAFTFSPTAPVVNQTVCFDAQSTTDQTGQIIAVGWDFGDGGTASGTVVCHEYRASGQFTVTLTVQDSNRNCDTTTQTITVDRGSPATCSIVASPTSPEIGETVNFIAVTTDPDGRVRRFDWSFGDGDTTRTSRNTVTHSYDSEGSFTVLLTVTDDQGNVSTCSVGITVGGVEGDPTCSFTVSPTNILVGTPVAVNASASDDPDGTIVDYNVDFGDGTPPVSSSTAIITKPGGYTAAGTYTVTLVVTDDDGNTAVCNQSVVVCPASGCTAVTQCNDGIDNDGDTFIDLADPQCSGPSDDNETS